MNAYEKNGLLIVLEVTRILAEGATNAVGNEGAINKVFPKYPVSIYYTERFRRWDNIIQTTRCAIPYHNSRSNIMIDFMKLYRNEVQRTTERMTYVLLCFFFVIYASVCHRQFSYILIKYLTLSLRKRHGDFLEWTILQ